MKDIQNKTSNSGNALRYIRSKILYKSMEDIANALEVSTQAVYQWENNKKKVPEKRLKQLSDLTGIPKQYFTLKEITQTDKAEMQKYWMKKQFESMEDGMAASMSDYIDLLDVEISGEDLLHKISSIFYRSETGSEEDDSIEDKTNRLEIKISVFNRVADIVAQNKEPQYLYSVLKALEKFYDINADKHYILGKMPPYPTDSVSEDSPLVQELCAVLEKYRNMNEEKG